jgi:hypothetical protein
MSIQLGKTFKNIAIGGVLAASATAVYAANDGVAGGTSEGDLLITLNIADTVKISNLSDIVLPAFSGVDLQGTSAACVYRNTGADYTLTASGGVGGGGPFQLDDGAATTIDYAVEWNDGSGFAGVATGVPSNFTNAAAADDDCGGGAANNGNVRVTVAAADAVAAGAAAYTGTLTLLVAPI